eukprot:1149410-Pelagomonas_calceolata.AAC.2
MQCQWQAVCWSRLHRSHAACDMQHAACMTRQTKGINSVHSVCVCFRCTQDYDLNGDYIRAWVPELKNVPAERIHEPWLMSKDEMRRYAVRMAVEQGFVQCKWLMSKTVRRCKARMRGQGMLRTWLTSKDELRRYAYIWLMSRDG